MTSPRADAVVPHTETVQLHGRVLIVGADALFVDALSSTLSLLGLTTVDATSTSPKGDAADGGPDIVLFDADGPRSDPALVVGDAPNAKRIWMSSMLDANRVRTAIRLGFDAVISKDITAHRFETAVRAVLRGDVVIETNTERPDHDPNQTGDTARLVFGSLTERERQILALLVKGAPSGDIAQSLSVSPHTVRTHVQNVMTKLQVHSRVEAVAYAVRHGLVERNGHEPTAIG